MKASITITKLIFLALFIFSNVILAQNQTISVKGTQIQISSTLQTMLEQAEVVYAPSGYTMDAIYNDAPDLASIFLGLIMQRQEIYMNQFRNVNHLKNNTALHGEILTFIGELAKAHNYINPVDGSKLSPIDMHKDFKSALNGDYNNVYINKFGINPTTANVAYILDRTPNTVTSNIDDYGKIQVAEKKNEINLFGHVSDHADEFQKDHIDKKEWDPSKPFTSDVILGAWYYKPSCQKVNIVFTRGEKGYSAITNNSDYSYTKWNVSRVKGNWDQPEKKMYWNEHYKATKQTIKKEDGSVIYTSTMAFYIHPYRDKMVLSQYYQSTGITWSVYKPF